MGAVPWMERAGSFIVDDAAASAPARPGRASWYTPGLSDALGDRLLMFDNSTASPLELLRFKRELSSVAAFEAALRDRVERLVRFSHPSFGRVRAVKRLDEHEDLALVSNQTPGRRLSAILHDARGPTYATELVRQLTPALAALHQQDAGVGHGALTADRIIVTPEGKLVIVEHVLGSALESLSFSAPRLRSELGLAVAGPGDVATFTSRTDLVQLGMIALSLVVGRPIDPADYPDNLRPLLDELTPRDGYGSLAALRLRWWLEHALQLDGRTFASASEAQDALLELPEDSNMQPAEYPRLHRPTPGLPEPEAAPAGASSDTAAPDLALVAPPDFLSQEPAPVFAPVIEPTPGPSSARGAHSRPWFVVALMVLTLIEAAVIGWFVYQRRASAATAAVNQPLILIESDMIGAQVLFDGKKMSMPVMLNVTPGMKSIHLLAPEQPGAQSAAVGGDAGAAGSGQLEVTSDPPGARVSIDGARRGVTPLTLPLLPGQHAVIISDGATNVSRTVTVTAGATATVMAGLAPAGAVAGWLTIPAPFELQVLEGGSLIGTTSTARLMLSAGHHDLVLKNTTLGFETKASVDIQAGKTLTTPIVVPNGSLSVNALPWATVLLDGKEIGTTPIANLDVPLGSHELVFRHPQLGERKQTVVVTARAPVRVVQDLRK
jgi:PEGA domain